MVAKAEFEGRTVIVTGAGGGLGSAIVELLADRGARVVGCDQSEEALASPRLASRHVFDLLDRASVETAVKTVLDRDGVPDILINNAGWTRAETLGALTADRIEHELDLNLTGVMTFADPIGVATAGGTTPYGAFFGGVQVGYEHHFASRLMLGVELDMSFAGAEDLAQVLSYRATEAGTANQQLEYLASLRGRVGYDFGRWTPFLTGGIAWASVRSS
ncbi:SDR family NAD(P)-dependent oxidoreductase, partial [Mesorhizobium sp.]|uniref:SDR family NAD(P)-dependent oxidoreductase n=1 Tax=Mesorhizobium sp. TaxID=1871066 RepID=UPI0025F7B382